MIESVIFAFGYRARSGKDTAVAEIIKQRSAEYDVRRYAFADALKIEVTEAVQVAGSWGSLFHRARLNGLPDWVTYDPDPDMSDPLLPQGKQRKFLQWWGGEFRRRQNKGYWIDRIAKRIAKEKPEIALITDLRYRNEFNFCKKFGEVVKVERPGLEQGTHASETELDYVSPEDWSLILENSGTLEEFKEGALCAFDELLTNFP